MMMMRSLSILSIIVITCQAFAPSAVRKPAAWTDRPSKSRVSTVDNRSGSDTAAATSTQSTSVIAQRRIANVEKYARLPVWPVWQGVFLFLAGKVFGQEVAASWEDAIGGRVCPNFFTPEKTTPFVLLVHHRHAFMNWDPVRYIQRTFFPEGFPAHPHRGFITVTYILKGGFYHRDSVGVKQSYGAEERHRGNHVQWLTAGAGIQHEEMWDIEPDEKGFLWTSSQELYQIWLNLPAADKMAKPNAQLLQAYPVDAESLTSPPPGTIPIITSKNGSTITTVVAGEHDGVKAPMECPTNASIIRIQFTQKASTWIHNLPRSHETAILYVKKGSIEVDNQRIPPHHTVYLTQDGEQLTIKATESEADVLLLSGEPLREPIASQGSMVMNTQGEIQKAYMDYQRGYMGMPWDHKISDEEWREHVKNNPSRY